MLAIKRLFVSVMRDDVFNPSRKVSTRLRNCNKPCLARLQQSSVIKLLSTVDLTEIKKANSCPYP